MRRGGQQRPHLSTQCGGRGPSTPTREPGAAEAVRAKASEPKRELLRAVAPEKEIGPPPDTTYEARSQMKGSRPAASQPPQSEPFATEDRSKTPSAALFENIQELASRFKEARLPKQLLNSSRHLGP